MMTFILNILTGDAELDINAFPKCTLFISPLTLGSYTLLDITSAVINLYLFIKPVLKLRSAMNDSKDTTLKLLAMKQCILSFIAILTTIVALIGFGMLDLGQLFIGSDLNLSSLCIIFS